MIKYYYKSLRSQQVKELEDYQRGCWVYVEAPDEAEIKQLTDKFKVEQSLVEDALDIDEMPRLERDGDQSYIYVRFAYKNDEEELVTVPLLFIFGQDILITVSMMPLPSLDIFLNGKIEFATGNMDKAYEYLRQAELNIKKPPLSTQKDIYKALYDLYSAKGDYKKSSGYLVKYSVMSDSITRYNNTFQAGLSIMELEANRLANQVELLTKDKELQVLIASKKGSKGKNNLWKFRYCTVYGGNGVYPLQEAKESESPPGIVE